MSAKRTKVTVSAAGSVAVVESGPFCAWDQCLAPLDGPARFGCGSQYIHDGRYRHLSAYAHLASKPSDVEVAVALRTAVEACERLVAVAAVAGDERLAMMARPAAGALRRQLTEREEKKS